MAKVLHGSTIGDIRGSVGAGTHTKGRFGAVMRQHVSPVQPRTPTVMKIRALFTTLSKRWATILTDGQRAGWNYLASITNYTNAFGNTYHPTGLQLYQSCNRNLQLVSEPIIDDAPDNLETAQLTTLAASASVGGSTLTLAFTPTPTGATQCLCVDATPQVNAGRAFIQAMYRLIDWFPGAKNSPAEMFAAYVAKFGALRLGQRITVRCWLINTDNGAAGQEISATCIVAA